MMKSPINPAPSEARLSSLPRRAARTKIRFYCFPIIPFGTAPRTEEPDAQTEDGIVDGIIRRLSSRPSSAHNNQETVPTYSH